MCVPASVVQIQNLPGSPSPEVWHSLWWEIQIFQILKYSKYGNRNNINRIVTFSVMRNTNTQIRAMENVVTKIFSTKSRNLLWWEIAGLNYLTIDMKKEFTVTWPILGRYFYKKRHWSETNTVYSEKFKLISKSAFKLMRYCYILPKDTRWLGRLS